MYAVIAFDGVKCVVPPPVETPSEDRLDSVPFDSATQHGEISPFLFPSFERYRQENMSVMLVCDLDQRCKAGSTTDGLCAPRVPVLSENGVFARIIVERDCEFGIAVLTC